MMKWIPVGLRVPDNRRTVLTWGTKFYLGTNAFARDNLFLGEAKFNQSKNGGRFDIERGNMFIQNFVTHWCEIEGPHDIKVDLRDFLTDPDAAIAEVKP